MKLDTCHLHSNVKMFAVIVLSLLLGLVVGAAFANFDYLRSKVLSWMTCKSGMPYSSVYSRSLEPGDCFTVKQGGKIGDIFNQSNEPVVDTFDSQVEKYEKDNNTRLIFINHRKKKNSAFAGISLFDKEEYLTMDDANAVLDILRKTDPTQKITLILNTNGGNLDASEVIVNALLNHKGEIETYIPRYARSAGLILALASTKIYMEPNAFVGPADPQISLMMWQMSAADIQKYAVSSKDRSTMMSLFGDLCGLYANMASSSIGRTRDLVWKMCETTHSASPQHVWNAFFQGHDNHDRPIFYSQARASLPHLEEKKNDELFKLFVEHGK